MISVPWPGHPGKTHELTDVEIQELRASAAAERITLPDERPGDRDLARKPIHHAALATLRRLGLIAEPGPHLAPVTDAGRKVLALIEGPS